MLGIERIKKIQEINRENPEWVNDGLYKLLLKEDTLMVAYEMMKSKTGNMTSGVTGETLDGFSKLNIKSTIEQLSNESFQFSPAKRSMIPKANGKTRPLGIAPPREKIVQFGIKMILEAIYEPNFSDDSHGFRPNRGCHTALRQIRNTWSGTSWIVEGDIKSFFDEIDHNVLIKILRKKIKDERFISLIWKTLRAGYSLNGTFHKTMMGTPQGSIVSPMLANIYLSEFDQKVEEWKNKYAKGASSKAPPSKEYVRNKNILFKARKAIKEGNFKLKSRAEHVETIRECKKLQVDIPARAGGWHRIRYIRYADDWMISIIGDKALAEEMKAQASIFLKQELKLSLSLEKTHIRHAGTETAKFLGTSIKMSKGRLRKGILKGTPSIRRSGVGKPVLKVPIKSVLESLAENGFCCRDKYEPKHRTEWQNMEDWEIVNRYNAVFRGIYNYYCFAANKYEMDRVMYILHHSCAKTLCAKHNMGSLPKLFRKYGRNLVCKRIGKNGITKTVEFFIPENMKVTPDQFLCGEEKTLDDIYTTYHMKLTKSKLGLDCVICGSSNKVEMHHVKHVRKLGEKVKGFTKLMALINRKQIPACQLCHNKIHRGAYDGISLGQLADKSGACA